MNLSRPSREVPSNSRELVINGEEILSLTWKGLLWYISSHGEI